MGKWQCLEEQNENVLTPFQNKNLGTTFSLFVSGWPLSSSHKGPVLPWAGRWPSCYLMGKKNNNWKKQQQIPHLRRSEEGASWLKKISISFQNPDVHLYLASVDCLSPQWLTTLQVITVYTTWLANNNF